MKQKRESLLTHTGHPLTPKESIFIDEYVSSGNIRQSVIKAGYKTKAASQYGYTLMNKVYIMEEINWRIDQMKSSKIADATEIMEYFSSVMRGEVTDQFGLEAPLSERTKAAMELAKRQIDIQNRGANKDTQAEVTIKLDWSRD